MVQSGDEPLDWKPMRTVGAGVTEIRVHRGGEFCVLYIATFDEAVYVLHCFQKKSKRTRPDDIALARRRYRTMLQSRK